ncbi:AAA family ATPase [Mariniflexile litorale]|uniref:AAA family ATPase n=1 Tax=Mariniflexile litorale TaxID=3045158 RepID=A0AAU7EDZ0_9FLAO|nr:AAA family ATPase [Mariniflexile sp. KMM 9835]MDQ8212320.1 AAA family ATPase [Mariniflexile sp. KMM 9835]
MEIIENIKQKATFLNRLSNNEETLFEHINSNHDNLDEVIQQYKPEREFKPVNTLRFLIANELKKGTVINATVINQLKQAIEARDVSAYVNLNETVKQSLLNYKDSKKGMFPNWGHTFKVLFPFLYNASENTEVNAQLERLADEIIQANQLENVTKHIVSFQGSNKYGSDHAWVAIIPETAPSVQYAYQIFFTINKNGVVGGLHKGHNLTKQVFTNQDIQFNTWEDYIEHTKQAKDQWSQLNSEVNFIFLNDEQAFVKILKKVDDSALSDYFKTLDRLKEDLDIQDEEKFVFSIAGNRLSFHVGKRYCLNVNKKLFDFISYTELEGDNKDRETFTGSDVAYFYRGRTVDDVLSNYEDIKSAIETEIERDNHTLAKLYDNSAFRKAAFDKVYRERIFNQCGIQNKYYLVGAYWDDNNPKDQTNRFVAENIWRNGYDDKFLEIVNRVPVNSHIAIKTVDRKGDNMYIKARGIVKSNLNDGQNLMVKWDKNFKEFKVDFSGGYWDTITNVNKADHIKAIWDNNTKNHTAFYNPPLNQIFYGPPGTGKTYHTILEAAKIITGNEAIDYDSALNKFNENLGDQIEFITFHQNYSYEDFIQGLRPDIEQKALSFNRADGVFTRMVTNALFEYYKVYQQRQKKSVNSEKVNVDLNDAYIEFINSLSEGQEFETKTGMKIKVDNFTDRQNIEFKPLNGIQSYLVSGNRLLKLYEVFNDINDIKRVHEDIRDAIGGCNSSIYYVALREFISFLKVYEKTLTEFVDVEEEYDYENISYRRKKELLSNISLEELRTVSTNEVPKYVIIIDEINRANISRVFGELITLIENDKRLGGKIPLRATLPSGEKFIVPSNLYIIGTMNTADKSIALLDIALRRRFEFVPMYPNSTSTEDKVVHDATILDAINQEIISRKGHDFTIGHSYFMGEDYNLKNTIDNKVIPLLLEYFMNDFEEVKKILSVSKLELVGWPMKLKLND